MNSANLPDVLFSLQDTKYQHMQRRLVPSVSPDTIIGVRTPELRQLSKKLEDPEQFKKGLPHYYFEENQVHAFLIGQEKNFDAAITDVEAFLPYVDNWATCDQLRPNVFRTHRQELLPYIRRWILSDHPYTIRFGVGMLMCHYLDEAFDPAYPEIVASIQSEHYYVKMMVAWYFATALAKQYDAVLPYITEHRLEKWTHNKSIQKALESYRITETYKTLLKSYRCT